jgi:hypothetical protein
MIGKPLSVGDTVVVRFLLNRRIIDSLLFCYTYEVIKIKNHIYSSCNHHYTIFSVLLGLNTHTIIVKLHFVTHLTKSDAYKNQIINPKMASLN